jgi:FimV-like protein
MRNYSLLFFVTLISLNIFADIRLSSPQIKLDSQDQRVIEIKIQDANIKDGDIFLNQYKSSEPINEADISYTLIENFGSYQTFTIVLSEQYLEDYFSFKLRIKDKFEKDIFIFLPSKIRNYNSNQPLATSITRNIQEDVIPIEKNPVKQKISKEAPKVIKAEEITTMWSMAEKVKLTAGDISIYQIMWAIYLGNKDAFIEDNINLIRNDVDISVPDQTDMQNISYEFAKDSILEMNDAFTSGFSSASRSLLVLTAPTVTESIEEVAEDPVIEENENLSLDGTMSPKDIIEKNTKDIKVGIESEVVDEFFDKVAESEEQSENSNIEIIDLIFISLISLISGILLALIYINFRKIKSSRNNIEYDFEEAEEDNSDNIMPSGLSVENNEDQQQLDLAIMYFEMDNKKRALSILNNIINKTNNESIKEYALSLLNKIK